MKVISRSTTDPYHWDAARYRRECEWWGLQVAFQMPGALRELSRIQYQHKTHPDKREETQGDAA